jgi:hypothetical protein
LEVPRRRAPPPAGEPPSPEVRHRERYLANPTRLVAAGITFYCPRAYADEVRLVGDAVRRDAPGRRVAVGHARLVCRELTLEGERISLRIRDEGEEDVSLTARGNVRFVSVQGGRVFREEGVRLLLVSNDQVTPLR